MVGAMLRIMCVMIVNKISEFNIVVVVMVLKKVSNQKRKLENLTYLCRRKQISS